MKPNIIFMTADQLGAKWVGCYGSGVDSTPGLDRLAAEGVLFNRCYATFPVCAPNRATMLSGRSPVVHGLITNNQLYPDGLPTYAHVLRRMGYRTGGFGKFHQFPMHLSPPENVSYLGFDESLVTEDPKWPWYEWVKREHPEHAEAALSMCWAWPTLEPHPEQQRALQLRRQLSEERRAEYGWRLMGSSPLPSEVHDTTYITELSLDFMQRHCREHPDVPFLCHISYVDPHDPYDPPSDYADLFDLADMSPPVPAEWLDEGIETLRRGHRMHGLSEVYDKPEVMARLRALFHAQLKYMDDQIGRLVSWLKETGEWERTILVFTSDHGEMLGDHGLLTKGAKHYDAGIRCPLIVAGGPVQAGTSEALISTLDFFPTFCEWAGVGDEDLPPLEGQSFAPACRGEGLGGPNCVAVAAHTVTSVITTDGWRLTRFLDDGKGQMFDLVNDPDEQQNRYDAPDCSSKKVELLEKLTEIATAPARVYQYRNMPVFDGARLAVKGDQVVHRMRPYDLPWQKGVAGRMTPDRTVK